MNKHILAAVMVLILAVGIPAGSVWAEGSAYDANGFAADGSYQPAAYHNEYYEIQNAGQLYWFSEHVNSGNVAACAKLIRDIAFEEGQYWTPIGNYQTQYAGTFDGCGFTVTGLTYTDAGNKNSTSYVGLFGAVTGGTVKNLKLVNATVTTASGKYGAGIAVGNLTGGEVSNVELTNCALEKTASNDVCMGGIVGYNAGTVSNCVNSAGTVKSTGGSYCYVGGIAGRSGTKDAEIGQIHNCTNGAEISTISGFDCVGGIVGKNTNTTTADSTTVDCTNNGTVRGATAWGGSRIGGIVGDNDGLVQACFNSGNIFSQNTSAETSYNTEFGAGGIVGSNDGKVEICGNSGMVSGIQHFGGIVGYFNNSAGCIKNCWNTGKLFCANGAPSALCAGGIVGHLLDGSVENCWSQVNFCPFDTNQNDYFYAEFAIVGVRESNPRYTGTIQNCYYSPTPGDPVANGDDGKNGTELISTRDVQGGKLALLLNGGVCSEDALWRQTLGEDLYPIPDSTRAVVQRSCGSKAFSNSIQTASDHSFDANGFCTVCDAFQNAVLVTAENHDTLGLTQDYVGYYAIANAGQLYWFSDFTTTYPFSYSDQADAGKSDANAVLVADITVNTDVLDEDGTCTTEPSRRWIPICGRTEHADSVFTGTFDGNGHTISGLYGVCLPCDHPGWEGGSRIYSADTNYITGVVGYLGDGGCIRNLTVADSYFSGAFTGGIAGVTVADAAAAIEGCVFDGYIRPRAYLYIIGSVNGGILGESLGHTTIKNSATTGIVLGGNMNVWWGGIANLLDENGTLTCENVLYVRQSGSAHTPCYYGDDTAIYDGITVFDTTALAGQHTAGVPIEDLLSMGDSTVFDTNVYTLGGSAWPGSDGKSLWLGKAGTDLTLTISLNGRLLYAAADLSAAIGESISLNGTVTMAKQAAEQTLKLDLTTVSRYFTRGNPVFTLGEWTKAGLTSAGVDGNILTLVAADTADIAKEDSVTLSVSGLADYKQCTITVTVTYTDKTPVTITGVQAAAGLTYSGEAQNGYTGTPTSDHTGAYDIRYTGIGATSYGPDSHAPKDPGTYQVTISVPESNPHYTGSITLNFSIAVSSVYNAERVQEAIAKLPDAVTPDDEETAQSILDTKRAYDALTDSEKEILDDAAKKKLDDLVAALTAYAIIKGDRSSWTQGSDTGLSFTANGAFGKFTGIQIDGKEISKECYDARSGSTVIVLKAAYLDTLSVGKHTITIVYPDGEASGTFTILDKAASPATGDGSLIALCTYSMSVSIIALAVLIWGSEKKHRKTQA